MTSKVELREKLRALDDVDIYFCRSEQKESSVQNLQYHWAGTVPCSPLESTQSVGGVIG